MRAFVATLLQREKDGGARLFARPIASILKLRWNDEIDYHFPAGGDKYDSKEDYYENVTRKYNNARDAFLAGNWSHFFAVEHDMIVPEDALQKLMALDVDIAYGLYALRHGDHDWNAYTLLEYERGVSLSKDKFRAKQAWGGQVRVNGVGLGCTLIARHVVEALPFHHWKGVHCDWALAYDAQKQGYTQAVDTTVVCGHMSLLPAPRIYWPDVNEARLYRTEMLT